MQTDSRAPENAGCCPAAAPMPALPEGDEARNVALAALAHQDAETAGKALEAAQQSVEAFVAEVSSTTQVATPAARS